MQETWKLKLLSTGKSKSIDIQKTLELEHKELGIFLSYYFKKEGALTENVKLKGEVNFRSELSGDFTLDFDLVHFNACLNIHDTAKDEMKINFELNNGQNELNLIGPYFPERGMDEI
ncbi:hypothetical protein MM213_10365 [Belliella sp. R4-6]|uniref:Uncharacterized protein n=1 Tax=Belliella alkalica TaxID=1730871 RepID=A0ABS9VD73_9BACT|nr:hypothetical protein [Belliella alkalica]MCH7413890.1 hypothetical protein [Belliella alkalica]